VTCSMLRVNRKISAFSSKEVSMRSGQQYLESIRDKRSVFIDGQPVENLTEHAAFRGITRTVASLYDYAADPASGMQFNAPEISAPANKAFMIPRSQQDLFARRE